jgi:hypothetical protein
MNSANHTLYALVSDCLHSSPSKCTVIALYRRLVVGAAFMSSPEETYITYLAVRPGWEGAGIATCVCIKHLAVFSVTVLTVNFLVL